MENAKTNYNQSLGFYNVNKTEFEEIYSYENFEFHKKGPGIRKSLHKFLNKVKVEVESGKGKVSFVAKDRLASKKSNTITMIVHHSGCDTRLKLTVAKSQVVDKETFKFNVFSNSIQCLW